MRRGTYRALSGSGLRFRAYELTDSPAAQASPGSSTVTFSNVAFGAPAPNRIAVVSSSLSVNNPTACTIGGLSATKAVEESSTVSALQIWYVALPSGLTANVVFSCPGTPADCMIAAGMFYQGASLTPTDTDTQTPGSVNTFTFSGITIPTGGFGLCATAQLAGSLAAATWTNTTASAGDTSNQAGSGVGFWTAHSLVVGTPSIDWSVAATNVTHGAAVSWGP